MLFKYPQIICAHILIIFHPVLENLSYYENFIHGKFIKPKYGLFTFIPHIPRSNYSNIMYVHVHIIVPYYT